MLGWALSSADLRPPLSGRAAAKRCKSHFVELSETNERQNKCTCVYPDAFAFKKVRVLAMRSSACAESPIGPCSESEPGSPSESAAAPTPPTQLRVLRWRVVCCKAMFQSTHTQPCRLILHSHHHPSAASHFFQLKLALLRVAMFRRSPSGSLEETC